jgi:hypothetical protein
LNQNPPLGILPVGYKIWSKVLFNMLHKLKAIKIEQKLYLLFSIPRSRFHISLFSVMCFLFIQKHFLAIKLSSINTNKYIHVSLSTTKTRNHIMNRKDCMNLR